MHDTTRKPIYVPPVYVSGLDLGQAQDPSALAVLEKTPVDLPPAPPTATGAPARRVYKYACRHLERWPLGTSYVDVIDRLGKLFADKPLKDSWLVVDGTGVGRAVVDMIKKAKVSPNLRAVTITGGHAVTFTGGSAHVPKKDLVGCLQVLLQSRRLKIAPGLPDAETLVKELQNFKVKVTAAANEVFEAWREGEHDDLVLALAVAAWWGERSDLHAGPAQGVGVARQPFA